MPVYRLTPRKGTESSPLWRGSSLRPQCLWVRAEDEIDARCLVAMATRVQQARTDSDQSAPWNEARLVACEYDDSRDIATGIIYVRGEAIAQSYEQRANLQ